MIRSELKDRIVWLVVDGELAAADVMREVEKWAARPDVIGYISDLRQMQGTPPAAEQKKLEVWRKSTGTRLPNAMLGRDNAMSMIVKIYIRFTQAEGVRYFTDEREAVAWIRNFKAGV